MGIFKNIFSRKKEPKNVNEHANSMLNEIHSLHRGLNEEVFYPAHSPRTETPQYKAIHNKLTKEQDLPCLVCGVKNSTLNDATKNYYKATAMETHHHHIEWALANAVDLKKFNEKIVARKRLSKPDDPTYNHDFTQKEMEDWVDHHPDNLWVLCDVHHRHKFVGIHSITGPIWGAQDLMKDDYALTPVEKELQNK